MPESPSRSSESAPLPPTPQASGSPPQEPSKGDTLAWGEGGEGSQFSQRDRHYGTLYTSPFSLRIPKHLLVGGEVVEQRVEEKEEGVKGWWGGGRTQTLFTQFSACQG